MPNSTSWYLLESSAPAKATSLLNSRRVLYTLPMACNMVLLLQLSNGLQHLSLGGRCWAFLTHYLHMSMEIVVRQIEICSLRLPAKWHFPPLLQALLSCHGKGILLCTYKWLQSPV